MHSRQRSGENFSVARIFLKLVTLAKWGRPKKDTNAGVAGRILRKDIEETAAEQLCTDNISTGLNESNDSSISDSSESLSTSLLLVSSFRILTQNHSFLSPRFFPYTIATASFAWRTFASSLIDVFSFLLRCFRLFKLVLVFNLVDVYLNLIELHLIPKILGSQNNNADIN